MTCARLFLFALLAGCGSLPQEKDRLRAGASKVDITPGKFPVIVNGGFFAAQASKAESPLYVRALALDDGRTRLAIAVVDTCMLPRELLDEAKALTEKALGLPSERMLISATHTHSAPSAMGCLGTPADPDYPATLPAKISQAIVEAVQRLAPARAGWAVAPALEHTNCRRWIRRPDKMLVDPFGEKTVRAHMHPGYQNPDVIGPSGPVDPDLSLLSIQTAEGRPLALLANYSMHYFGASPVSADFTGAFCRKYEDLVRSDAPFVAILSQGTSGDQHWMDYSRPKKSISLPDYSQALVGIAEAASRTIVHRQTVSLAMAETKLRLRRRVADGKRLEWARGVEQGMQGRGPKNLPEIYAREQIILAAEPERELKLQAVRIGEMGIAAIPNEVYGITGLKIKAQSPLMPTFTIELANGAEGYIPPPEQHKLGGYTTWAARTAGLEVEAEPKILEAVLRLLEEVSGQPRRPFAEPKGAYADAVRASGPAAYWRLEELSGPEAGVLYEDGIALALPGPAGPGLSAEGSVNRCVHFAGGRLRASVPRLGSRYSVEFWFWNGLSERARPVTGHLFSRGEDHLGIAGMSLPDSAGKLFFSNGNETRVGRTAVPLRTWNHVVLARDGKKVDVYLNGIAEPEISGDAAPGCSEDEENILIAGRSDGLASFEGKIDEVALYARVLSAEEAAKHHAASGHVNK